MKQIKEVRFYLEVDLYEKIAKLAEKDNRDFSNMVETVLKRWVEKEESFWLFGVNNPAPPGPRPIMHPGPVGPSYPKTSPVSHLVPCEGTTVGPNGAMFASTDNPNGTCVTNGEEVDIKADIIPCISPEFLKRWENNGDNKFPEEELVVRTDTDPAKVVLDTEDDDFGF